MSVIDAVYQGGVFRPTTPPDLPDGTSVTGMLNRQWLWEISQSGNVDARGGFYTLSNLVSLMLLGGALLIFYHIRQDDRTERAISFD